MIPQCTTFKAAARRIVLSPFLHFTWRTLQLLPEGASAQVDLKTVGFRFGLSVTSRNQLATFRTGDRILHRQPFRLPARELGTDLPRPLGGSDCGYSPTIARGQLSCSGSAVAACNFPECCLPSRHRELVEVLGYRTAHASLVNSSVAEDGVPFEEIMRFGFERLLEHPSGSLPDEFVHDVVVGLRCLW